VIATGQIADSSPGRAAWLLNRVDWNLASITGIAPQQDDSGGGALVMDPEVTQPEPEKKKSKVLPMAMSLIVPGTGELYLGYKRGYFQIALDIAVWVGIAHYNSEATQTRDEYLQFADAHWSEDGMSAAYWSGHPNQYLAGVGLEYFDVNDSENSYTELPLWVSREEDEREYYENLGKWDQFVFGWDDFVRPEELPGYQGGGVVSDLRLDGISDNRKVYRSLRQESNDQFTKRDRLIYLNIATRIFSVFQVAYLQGLFGGGQKSELKVAGHPVAIIAEPRGLTSTRLGLAVAY
jgi:hypothetical protein